MRVGPFAASVAILLAGGCAQFQKSAEPEIKPVERIVGALPREQAEILLERGQRREAAAAFRAILSGDPDNIEARYGLAEALRLSGEPEASKAEYIAVAPAPDWSVRALEGLGQANLMTGDHDSAYEAFAAAVETDPNAWRAWLGLAQLRDLARDWAKADEAYASALAGGVEPAIVYNNQGVSMLARGESEAAAALFRKALEADPSFDRAKTNLELATASAGAAVDAVAAAEPDARKRAQILNNYGYVAMLRGRLDEAERYFEAAIEAHPSFYAVAYENLKVLKALQANAPDR